MPPSRLVRAAVVGVIAAIVAAAAQKLLIGDVNTAVTGGVAGALAVVVMLTSRGKADSGD